MSLIAARSAMVGGGGKGWKNPYVTDGLIAMWDGEWNAGGGVHDSNLRAANLAGSGDMVFDSSCVVGNNSISFSSNTSDPATSGLTGWGGVSDPIQNLPEKGPTIITTEYVGNFPPVNSWSRKSYPFLFRGSGTVVNNEQTYCLLRRTTGNPFGRYSWVTDNATSVYSFSASSFAMLNGVQVDLGFINWSFLQVSDDDTRVRVMGAVSSDLSIGFDFRNLRIYNRQLTADEIAANFAIDKARFNLP